MIEVSEGLVKILVPVVQWRMGLRNILLFISIIIVGFCLSLYFQTRQTVQSVNWDQYKNLQYSEDRSHSLAELNQKLTPYQLENIIQETFERNRLAGEKTRVMEIGSGNGRTLMELKKLFPEVEFYGINREKTHTFYRRESFIMTALKFEIFNKTDIEHIELPYVVFQDLDFGGKLPYDNNKFDLIYSQDFMSNVKYKFEILNEILRVLKPGGLSLHSDFSNVHVYAKGIVLDLRDALGELRRLGFDINTLEDRKSIRLRKNSEARFPLSPHQPIPEDLTNIPKELRRPEMGYNLIQ